MRARKGWRAFGLLALAVVLTLAFATGCAAEEPIAEPEPAAPSEPAVETPAQPDAGLPDGATHTVAGILAAPRDGEVVVLSGTVKAALADFNFTFTDGTGDIFVDGDNDFGVLSAGDAVVVTGAVDVEDSPARVEIDATAVTKK